MHHQYYPTRDAGVVSIIPAMSLILELDNQFLLI